MGIHRLRKQQGSHRIVPGSAGSPVAALRPLAAGRVSYGEVIFCFGVTV